LYFIKRNSLLMLIVVLTLFYLLFPAFIMYLIRKIPVLKKVGPVIIAYLTGLIFGNIFKLPSKANQLQETICTIVIPLAIPMLLFTVNIKSWFNMAGKTILTLFIGVISVMITVTVGYIWFGSHINEGNKIAGMLSGLYTGGTPNLAAIAEALNVDAETYILTHSYDLLNGVIFLIFVIAFAQRLFNLFLPAYKHLGIYQGETEKFDEDYIKIFNKKNLKNLFICFVVALLIFGMAASTTFFISESHQMMVVILLITTFAIIASLFPKINTISLSFDFGMYLIVIFSLVVSSMADVSKFNFSEPNLLYFVMLVELGTIFVFAIFAFLFKIDSDNLIITTTALICSPPFVPVVAAGLKNKEIIFTGITIGVIGYAIGNYLGISTSIIIDYLNY